MYVWEFPIGRRLKSEIEEELLVVVVVVVVWKYEEGMKKE